MPLPLSVRDIPGRVATGAYILHAGLEKWSGDAQRAEGVHRAASAAFPVLEPIDPPTFLRLLSAAEIATGVLLLAPFVSNRRAGLALTTFSGSLIAMYLRTPAMHQPGSIWPTQAGTAVSKDVWMLGIGLGLLAGGAHRRRS